MHGLLYIVNFITTSDDILMFADNWANIIMHLVNRSWISSSIDGWTFVLLWILSINNRRCSDELKKKMLTSTLWCMCTAKWKLIQILHYLNWLFCAGVWSLQIIYSYVMCWNIIITKHPINKVYVYNMYNVQCTHLFHKTVELMLTYPRNIY